MEEPFVIATSALAASPCDLVRVETDEGLVGFGEACPAYEFTGDTLWTVQDVIGEYLGPAVIGKDPFQLEAIVHCWERELWTVGNQAACAALEMALWDLQGKALGRPLYDLLSLIHISEPTRLGMISYAVFCLKKKKKAEYNSST